MAQNKDDKNKQDNDTDLDASARLLREADEELRRERLEDLWKRWGGTLIMGCIAIVIGTAVGVYWNHHTQTKNMAQTDALYEWLAEENGETRLQTVMDDLKAPENSQEWLKLFYAANDALEQREFEKAADIYALLRADRDMGKNLRWLADLMELRVAMQLEDAKEEQDFAVIRTRLEDLAAQENNPWRAMAYYDAAVIAGQRQQDYKGALSLLDQASRESTGSSAMISMIRDLRHLYTVQADLTGAANDQTGASQPTDNPQDIAPAANDNDAMDEE